MSDTDVRPDTAPEPDAGAGAVVAARPRRVAPFVALAVALVLGGLFVVLAVNNPGSPDVAEPYLLNRPAPRVVSTTLDGDPFDLSRRKGSWVVINFFNTDCVGCIAEHGELVKFTEQQAAFDDGADGARSVVTDDLLGADEHRELGAGRLRRQWVERHGSERGADLRRCGRRSSPRQLVRVAEEPGRPPIDRAAVEVGRRAGLDDPAVAHDGDMIGERQGLLLVVGHEDGGRARGRQDVGDLVAE